MLKNIRTVFKLSLFSFFLLSCDDTTIINNVGDPANTAPLHAPGNITGSIQFGDPLLKSATRIAPQSIEVIMSPVAVNASAGHNPHVSLQVDGWVTTPENLSPPVVVAQTVTLDSSGGFDIELPAEAGYSLIVTDPLTNTGVTYTDINVSPNTNESVVINEVDFQPLGELVFAVQDQLNKSPLQANVTFLNLNQTIVTDAVSGVGTFTNLPAGNYVIRIDKAGYASKDVSFEILAAQTTDLGVLDLDIGIGSVYGKVIADHLENAANITVYAQAPDGTVFGTLTNASGIYGFDNLPVGDNYSFIISANDHSAQQIDNVQIQINQTVTLIDTIINRSDGDDGNISGFALFSERLNTQNHAGIIVSVENTDVEAITSRSGAYVLNGLIPGSYVLNFTEANHKSVTHTIEVIAASNHKLSDIVLNSQIGGLTGIVNDESGQLIANAFVSISNTGYTTQTDVNGAYSFSNIPIGFYNLLISKDGFLPGYSNIEIKQDTVNDLSSTPFNLSSFIFSGSLSLGESETDHSGVQLVLDGTSNLIVFSDTNGAFSFNGASPGNYQMTLSKVGYQNQTFSINLPDNKTEFVLPYLIQMTPVLGDLRGIATLASTVNHSGILVELAGTPYNTYTDSVGAWSMSIPIANYSGSLVYSKPLFDTVTDVQTVTITSVGTYTAANQQLAQKSATIDLHVSTTGSCPEVVVSLTGISGDAVGYSASFIIDATTGNLPTQELALGEYAGVASCTTTGWETYNFLFTTTAGILSNPLPAINLKQSFVIINDNAENTNNLSVALSIGNTDAVEMKINDGVNDSGWIAYSSSHNFTLSPGDGNRTINIDFKDVNANPLVAVQDSILLDTTLTINSFDATGATTSGDILHFVLDLNGELNADVKASVVGLVNELPLLDNGIAGDTTPNDGIYERDYQINVPVEFNTEASAVVTDIAGNTATVISSSTIIVNTSPSIQNVRVSSNVAAGEMTIQFSTDEPSTTQLEYGATANNLDQLVTIRSALSQSHLVTINGLAADTLTYYRITAKDENLNISQFTGEGKLAPEPVTGLAGYAGNAEAALVWNKPENVTGFKLYRLATGESSYTLVNSTSLITDTYFVDSAVSNSTTYTYKVTAIDVDGNESRDGSVVSVTPNLSLAGPTAINGGVIDINTVWLKSRSPYQINSSAKVKLGAELLLLPGVEIEFTQANQGLYLDGTLKGVGSVSDPIIISALDEGENIDSGAPHTFSGSLIYGLNNQSVSSLDYVELNYLKIYYDYTDRWTRSSYAVPLTLKNAIINSHQGMYDSNYSVIADFYIQAITDSVLNEFGWKVNANGDPINGYGYSASNSILIKSAVNSTFNVLDEAGAPRAIKAYAVSVNTATNSIFSNAGYIFNSIDNTTVTNSTISANAISQSILTDTTVADTRRLTGSTLVNTQVTTGGDTSWLTMHYNVLDSASTVSAAFLDAGYNYWGSTDLVAIGQQSGYSPDVKVGTHLYPIITSSLLYEADFDNDGLPDYLDYDNDNDGYSDLQEDWESDPVFGSIYNPLDASSYPSAAKDNDMDGIADSVDLDDDGDGLLDSDELVRLTDPFLNDSDGDGVGDGNEISFKYNPLDKNNYPLMGDISGKTIDNSNVNSDGVVYIAGHEVADVRQPVNLSSVTVAPGTQLMLEKDTAVNFKNSRLEGNQSNVITVRVTGSGNGSFNLDSTHVVFSNIKLTTSFNFDSNSTIDKSDLYFGRDGYNHGLISNSQILNNQPWYNYGIVSNSYSNALSFSYWANRGLIENSYLKVSDGIINYSFINNSYITNDGYGYLNQQNGAILTNSVVSSLLTSNESSTVTDSDVQFNSSGAVTGNVFFDNSYITEAYSAFSNYYDGLGAPTDEIGDGVAETIFTAGSSSYTVDGIINPRSTPHFNNHDLKSYESLNTIWNPEGVGAWWDRNNADVFAESNPDLSTGIISGNVQIAGYSDHSGVRVEMINTNLWTTTDAAGNWNISLPARVYSDGVSLSKAHMETVLKDRAYSIDSQQTLDLGLINMTQKTAVVSGVITVDETTDLTASIITATKGGVITTINPATSGEFEFAALPLGEYVFELTYPGGAWETVTYALTLAEGETTYNLALTRIRNSFVTINNSAEYTNSAAVTLAFTNTNAATMQITEGGVTQAVEAFSATKAFTLSAGDGVKTVSVAFFDSLGVALTPAESAIVLDTTLSLSSLTLSPVTTLGDTLHLTLQANEIDGLALVSIPGLVTNLMLFDNGLLGDTTAGDGIYERDYMIDSAEEITATAIANFTDRAANTASINSSSQLVIATSPTVTNLLTQTVNGQLVVSFATNELTTATISYGVVEGSPSGSATISATDAVDHSIALTLPAGELNYFTITTSDGVTTTTSLSSSASVTSSAVTELSAAAGDLEVGLDWNKEATATLYKVYRSTDSNNFSWIADVAADTYFVDSTVTNDQEYYYRVSWLDAAAQESDKTASVTVIPSATLAGPTEMDGGVIAVKTIWLKSRSPYVITNNMLIREGVGLHLMPGTVVDFNGAARHIYIRGYLQANGSVSDVIKISTDSAYWYDSVNQASLIYDTTNYDVSNFKFTELNYLHVYYDYSDEWDRKYHAVPLKLNYSLINSYSYSYSNFFIQEAVATVFNEYGYGFDTSYDFQRERASWINTVVDSSFNKLDASGSPVTSNNYIAQFNSVTNSNFTGASFYLREGSVESSVFNNARISGASSIKDAELYNSTVDGNYSLRVTDSALVNTQVTLSGDNTWLRMHFNVLDSNSTVNASYLDAGYNYWGSTDLVAIGQQSGYSPDQTAGTHLYPIITGSLIYQADWDGDGIPDYLDFDNDNDGYSDLQEDWESDPVYGSIFDPLDALSHPLTAKDNDMDGLANDIDTDDDNDGLLDVDEITTHFTDPFLVDSDGDGASDRDEIVFKYNALDIANYPLMGNISGKTIDNSNVNADGVVTIAGYENGTGRDAVNMTNVTVAAGTSLLLEKDTGVSFVNSVLEGDSTNIIKVRVSGAGNGRFNLQNTKVAYANIKLPVSFHFDASSVIDFSDLSVNTYGENYGAIKNSYIQLTSYIYNYGSIMHSYISGNSYWYNHGVLDQSYLNMTSAIYNNGVVNETYISNSLGGRLSLNGGSVSSSIVEALFPSSSNATVLNTDLQFSYSGASNVFFENSYIAEIASNFVTFYDGLGAPADEIGDGVAETVFTLGTGTYTVDGITSPRSTRNFVNGVDDIWTPVGVGALWDSMNPTVFPEPL